MSQLKVNTIRHTGASSDAVTLASDGTCTAKITNQPPGNRNLIINGAQLVAQRGTSSTTQSGYGTVDRMSVYQANTGVTITSSQVDVASGTPAYQSGFRKAIQITKGAGTAATNSQINLSYQIEAQDIANSGWDYTNPNSFLTFSFWVKTSVANHNPQVAFVDMDSSQSGSKNYQFEIPTLTANTWTKITHSIPGHADQVYDNNNAVGIHFYIYPWLGTDFTDNSNTMNAWSSFGTKDINTTWLTTNNSTFQVTGMQLEVGSVATDFEHRSYSDELQRCMRYFELLTYNSTTNIYARKLLVGNGTNSTLWYPTYKVVKRTEPSLVTENFDADTVDMHNYQTNASVTFSAVSNAEGDEYSGQISLDTTSGVSLGDICSWRWLSSETAWIGVSAEL